MKVFLFALGLLVVVGTWANVLATMVLPRRPAGFNRASLWVNRGVRFGFIGLARFARSFEAKDAIMAAAAPAALVTQLFVWGAAFIVGFGLMLQSTTHNLANGLLQALGSVFTVGAIHPGGAENLTLDVAAGAVWVVVVALQIAYLPALYGAFSQREALVAMLESRAGVPAWGPELLARHQLVGIIDTLPDLYSAWEEWAAAVAESHTTYPVMLMFRSPEPWFSWLLALLAVLDGAAMHLALSPATASSNARLCLRMGFTCLDRIGSMLGWHLDPDPLPEAPIALTYGEFESAVKMLEEVGFPIERTAEEAWPDFHGWRVNYEAVAYRLADRLVVPPAPWSGPRRDLGPGITEPRRPPQRRPASSAGASAPRSFVPQSRKRAQTAAPPGSGTAPDRAPGGPRSDGAPAGGTGPGDGGPG
jgi:hypothetical protein